MSRLKSLFALVVLALGAGLAPSAQAQTVKVVIAGASAFWQSLGLAAYNSGNGVTGAVAPTFHWTSASNAINLVDTRPSPVNVDPGTLWVVWDSATPPNVWVYIKTETISGVRCYFAQPRCTVSAPAPVLATGGAGQISLPAPVWGADTALPASVQALIAGGQFVNVAASDVRPEDAEFTNARENSQLGASAAGGVASDGLDGLGYNSNNAPGVPPAFPIGSSGKGVGSPILSGYPGSTTLSTILAFNIKGKDPFTGTTIPAFTVVELGAAPLVFITERDKGQLTNLTNASENQLQQVFSGTNCDASAFGLPAGAINIFLREPASGTGAVAESTVFRRPTVYPNPVLGLSQEANVNGTVNNPLKGQAGTCVAGAGARYRAIGTSEVVKSVLNSSAKFSGGTDGIGYIFFSYGNVTSIANNPNFGYLQLDGVDPIFQSYGGGNTIDPGKPTVAGELPGTANLPASCAGSFPCNESAVWGNGFSFPNLRNGTYRAWSIFRVISTGTPLTNVKALVKTSNQFAVTSVPDYVPLAATTAGGTADLGLKLLRSHYQQKDGAGVDIGSAPINTTDTGGDLGGLIIPTTIGVTTEKKTQLIQSSNSSDGLGAVLRP